MPRARRRHAGVLLLLLAVLFAPLLCKMGADPGRTAVARTGIFAQAEAEAALQARQAPEAQPASRAPSAPQAHTAPAAQSAAPVAYAPKKCSSQPAPNEGESVPVPGSHRGEPQGSATTGVAVGPGAPTGLALARPPTGTGSAADHIALLPVLRI